MIERHLKSEGFYDSARRFVGTMVLLSTAVRPPYSLVSENGFDGCVERAGKLPKPR